MNKHTNEDLKMLQALPLEVKIRKTMIRITEWYEYFNSNVYVSFSGGKDSTVLLDMARKLYHDIEAVFVDTGLEYPEIREFVKQYDNVTWLKPKLTFKQVVEKYGYPFISKEVSECVSQAKKGIESNGKYYSYRLARLRGELLDKDGNKSIYNQEKYEFLLYAPFNISNQCCNVMKKNPTRDFSKKTGKKPITAQMASESRLRKQQWIKNGCNGFDMKKQISNPMSFWTEQDVLQYIKLNKIPIASVYGDIVLDQNNKLKTTGCSRTGCMFCGYGCHLEKAGDGRFESMKKTHPKQYEFIMKPCEQGGMDYKNKIDWLNEQGNLDIKY